jgi:hypothetical protein
MKLKGGQSIFYTEENQKTYIILLLDAADKLNCWKRKG